MIGRRAVLGLSLLSALVFCAFAAPNAMALKGTTAFTCVKVTKEAKFTDEHCTKTTASGEGFVHEEIKPESGKTKLTVSNTETGSKLIFPKLKFTEEKEEVELEAGGFHSCVGGTTVENKVNVNKQMEAAGEFCGEFFNVVVNKPAGCVVAGGVVKLNAKGEHKTVVALNAKLEEEMYIEFKPPAGKPFATFTLEKCVNAALNGAYEITGSARANVSVGAGLDGATVKFTTAETEKTEEVVGAEGKAKFEATFTPRMEPEIGKEENPVTLTTTAT